HRCGRREFPRRAGRARGERTADRAHRHHHRDRREPTRGQPAPTGRHVPFGELARARDLDRADRRHHYRRNHRSAPRGADRGRRVADHFRMEWGEHPGSPDAAEADESEVATSRPWAEEILPGAVALKGYSAIAPISVG